MSRQYLNKAPKSVKALKIGDDLSVTSDYLNEALEQLFILGVLMASSVADRLIQDEEVRSVVQSQLSAIVDDALRRRQWKVVARLCATYKETFDNSAKKNAMRVNLWVSQKNDSGLDSIRGPVEEWDVSSLRQEFELAKMALLDKFEEAYALACDLAARGVLKEDEYSSDPLYESLQDWVQEEERHSPFLAGNRIKAAEITERGVEEVQGSAEGPERAAPDSER